MTGPPWRRRLRGVMRLAAFALAGTLAAASASAGQHYEAWSGSGAAAGAAGAAESQRLQEMVDELGALIDAADKARAADPRFLRDLRAVVRRYDRPWRRLLLSDDFQDGDFTANPTWQVSAGRYNVEPGWGLRSFVAPRAADPAPRQEQGAERDPALALLEGIIRQATGRGGGGALEQPRRDDLGAIHTALAITNGFSIDIELSSWKSPGRLAFGPYQGSARRSGYRLVYVPGQALTLSWVTRRGSSVVEATAEPLALEDKRTHRIRWNRHADGAMTVAVDGKQVLATFDRGFRDPFDGFLMINRGGDYIVRRITIHGTE